MATVTSVASGDWDAGATWDSDPAIPTAADDVVIGESHDVVVDVANAVAASVSVGAADAILRLATGGVLTVGGNVTATSGGTAFFGGGMLVCSILSLTGNGRLEAENSSTLRGELSLSGPDLTIVMAGDLLVEQPNLPFVYQVQNGVGYGFDNSMTGTFQFVVLGFLGNEPLG